VQGGTLQKNTTLAPAGQRPWTPKAGESAVTDWYDQGNRLHLEENRPLDAERAYRRAIEEAPTDARPWNGLGILLSDRLGRVDEAAAAFERAIALDPGFAAPWNGLGIHQQEQLCRPELAHDSFLKAIESDPLDFTPWCNLAGLLRLWRSDGAGATRAYKLALEIAPDEPFLWLGYGELALVQGDHPVARSRLERAAAAMTLRTDPQAAVLSLSLATALGRPDAATALAGTVAAVADTPARPVEAAVVLAGHAMALGQTTLAEHWRDRALHLLTRHHERLSALAECYGTAGLCPALRPWLADFARRLFAADQQAGRVLAGAPTPEALLRRFRRFTFEGGRGAGDPLDRPLWCREVAAAWLAGDSAGGFSGISAQELPGDAGGLGEADPLDLHPLGKGAVKPTRH
jgi:Flp pilus assembly protein TadD